MAATCILLSDRETIFVTSVMSTPPACSPELAQIGAFFRSETHFLTQFHPFQEDLPSTIIDIDLYRWTRFCQAFPLRCRANLVNLLAVTAH